jgi:TolB-like protein
MRDTKVYKFLDLVLDVGRGGLFAGDRQIELRPRSFDVLRFLVESADRLVTKDELVKALWPTAAVSDESIAHCISEARQAIGDSKQTIIKTVPRRGYRFETSVVCVAPQRLDPRAAGHSPQEWNTREAGSFDSPQLHDRPSVAVLPFQNMSDDAGQEHFADGMVEEIITALSRFSSLFVIARNSSFTYKGRTIDVKQVGRELGVRYVLEGSVRKSADRVRISGQLIDSTTGTHLWADRFDGRLDNVFDLQDRVSAGVVTAIAPKLERMEMGRARRKPTESLDAYDYFLRGMESGYQNTPETVDEALRLFSRAIELDTGFAAAYAMGAYQYTHRKAGRWMVDPAAEAAEAARLARKAVLLGRDDALVLSRAGHALAYVAEDLDAGTFYLERSLMLNPNLASCWLSSTWLRVWLGKPEIAIAHFANFRRMSPLDPQMPEARSASAFANIFSGNFDEASLLAEQALQENFTLHPALRAAAASHACGGRIERARQMIGRLLAIDPALRLSILTQLTPLRRAEDRERYLEAMRIAGLPE